MKHGHKLAHHKAPLAKKHKKLSADDYEMQENKAIKFMQRLEEKKKSERMKKVN